MSYYTFLPWLRQGLANQIMEGDGNTTVKERASIQVTVRVAADTGATRDVTQTVQLVGPGDVVGIDPRAVVRTEPQRWTANFEPNYLPFIEFYDEDLPWRYTPVSTSDAPSRLRPWLTLVVLEENTEFDENNTSQPLPSLRLKGQPAALFPNANELWAWAHVHANEPLSDKQPPVPTDLNTALGKLADIIDNNPDRAYSRLLSSRKLRPNTSYQAFVIPSFEPGRLAGLGLAPAAPVFATMSAWADYAGRPGGDLYPYYYRWNFKTGDNVDFEQLVRLLRPAALDPRVGVRPMDISRPQGGIDPASIPPERQTMQLEGALISPSAARSEFFTPPDLALRQQLVQLLNLPEKQRRAAPAGDPIITPPIYGQWHFLTPELPNETKGNFVQELNLDPRWRAAAGLGTRVIQANQEKYMEAAWQQVEGVLEANRKLNRLVFSTEALTNLFAKHFKAAEPSVGLLRVKNLHPKVLVISPGATPFTAKALIAQSPLESGAVSNAFRKVVRPRGAVALNSRPVAAGRLQLSAVVNGLNTQKLMPFPTKLATPTFLFSVEKAATALAAQVASPEANALLRPDQFTVQNVQQLRPVKEFVVNSKPNTVFTKVQGRVILGGGKLPGELQIPGGGKLPGGVQIPGGGKLPGGLQVPAGAQGAGDVPLVGKIRLPNTKLFPEQSNDDLAFRAALQKQNLLFEASALVSPVVVPQSINLAAVYGQVLQKIDPAVTMKRRALETVHLADYYQGQWRQLVRPVMAYPEFTDPMYAPLRDLSSEYLVPNLKMIQNNVISLLNVNSKFIEAYLTGLNHEFARELLWREYPTDQRGSFFRQFWDVREAVGASPDKAKVEQFKDVQELHRWALSRGLGDHGNRPTAPNNVVLVVRGELLKRYPNTVLYAQKAVWPPLLPNGQIDHTVVRVLASEDGTTNGQPNVMQPLFKAQILPDIYFVGFNLTAPQVKGDPGTNPAQDPGWFFVLRERPGEPRFGFDIGDAPNSRLYTWNEVNWRDLGTPDGAQLTFNRSLTLGNVNPLSGNVGAANLDRHNEDLNYSWNPKTNAADIAYIVYQDKVMVAIHGSEMLNF
jgi:hypothetical protein